MQLQGTFGLQDSVTSAQWTDGERVCAIECSHENIWCHFQSVIIGVTIRKRDLLKILCDIGKAPFSPFFVGEYIF